MNKLIEFTKIEATGNDFIFIDTGKFSKNMFSESIIRKMCDRHFGIGADGVIFIGKGRKGAFNMHYYNSDGLEAAMCANGGRGAILFAAVTGIVDCEDDVVFMASDGLHEAKIYAVDDIEIEILQGRIYDPSKYAALRLPPNMHIEGFADTGVPHLVINCGNDLENIDVNELGRRLRFDPLFGAEGTNVNFIKAQSDDEISIRSYERGIEGETLSCGTGAAAAALLLIKKDKNKAQKIAVNSKGGRLFVGLRGEKLFLRGPANIVYVGNLHLD